MRVTMYKDDESIMVHVTKVKEMEEKGWSTVAPKKKEVK